MLFYVKKLFYLSSITTFVDYYLTKTFKNEKNYFINRDFIDFYWSW